MISSGGIYVNICTGDQCCAHNVFEALQTRKNCLIASTSSKLKKKHNFI